MSAERILQAITVVCELTGTELSATAKAAMVEDLLTYPVEPVLAALTRCRRELPRGRLTLSEIIKRIDDGRPGVEEAWTMLPRDEQLSMTWTTEMQQAWGIAKPLLDAGEDIPARMAFKEAYTNLVAQARDAGRPVQWQLSLGHDESSRRDVVKRALDAGMITDDHAQTMLPAPRHGGAVAALLEGNPRPLLTAAPPTGREAVRGHLDKLRAILPPGPATKGAN